MENKIFKKHNSYENYKRLFFCIASRTIFLVTQICYQKFFKISTCYHKFFLYVYNGKTFIKLKLLCFFSGFSIGDFCLTKKHNKHLSFKKIKTQKR